MLRSLAKRCEGRGGLTPTAKDANEKLSNEGRVQLAKRKEKEIVLFFESPKKWREGRLKGD